MMVIGEDVFEVLEGLGLVRVLELVVEGQDHWGDREARGLELAEVRLVDVGQGLLKAGGQI